MSYRVHVIWEGCNVLDVLAEVDCPEWEDVEGLCTVMEVADFAPKEYGLILGLRIFKGEREIMYVGTRVGWDLPHESPVAWSQ